MLTQKQSDKYFRIYLQENDVLLTNKLIIFNFLKKCEENLFIYLFSCV